MNDKKTYMTKPVVFIFPGQGSHYFQMGRDFFEDNQIFKKWMLKLDEVAIQYIGHSLIDLLYDNKKEKGDKFDYTLFTHPSIFMVEYAMARTLIEHGIFPDYVLGSSMGEFAASAIAQIMSVEDVFQAIIKQAEYLEASCNKGGMMTIVHDHNIYNHEPSLNEKSELVSVNHDSHFVISGESQYLNEIETFLKKEGILTQRLPISHAFHSSLIDPAESMYKNFLEKQIYEKPKVSFISGLNGRLLTNISNTYFWDVVRRPIQFMKSIQQLEKEKSYIYLDVGASGDLANLIKRNLKSSSQSEVYKIITPFNNSCLNFRNLTNRLAHRKLKRKVEKKMTTFIFPGQGSQYKGMGGELFDEFENYTAKADKILGYSIKDLCLNDSNHQLGNTKFTQPALYVVNALSYLNKIKETGQHPDYVAGHSLGEYNALFAAGAIDFETGLKLVKKRGELMSEAIGGSMAAVIGLTIEQVRSILNKNKLHSIEIANYNSLFQIVVSGPKADIEFAYHTFDESGAKYIFLNVSGAFHSSFMKDAAIEFAEYLDNFYFSPPNIPVISNIYARPYLGTDIKNNLIQQITSQVKWFDSIIYLLKLGEMKIEEVGPRKVLTSLTEKIKNEASSALTDEMLVEENKAKATPHAKDRILNNESLDEVENLQHDNKKDSILSEGISLNLNSMELGDNSFKRDYKLKYAYITGAMYKGISSEKLVIKVGKAGMLGFFGTGGLSLNRIEESIQYIKSQLNSGETYGMNLLHNPRKPLKEQKTVDLFLKYNIKVIEASAYMSITKGLVRYRAKGLQKGENGQVIINNKIIAKISRPEVAKAFLSPAPENIVREMLLENMITQEEAEMIKEIPMADDICVEADSGGHTDQGILSTLMPVILRMRDEITKKYSYNLKIRIGAAGGIGTPEAAASAFMLGADFIVTGSINQCTAEAETSEIVKDLLQQANVQDTEYAPAGDMFELGAKVQVLKKGLFFPTRANRLYELYRIYDSINDIDEKTKKIIQEKYFNKSFEEIYSLIKSYYRVDDIEKADENPKYKMLLIFKWYFSQASRLALSGDTEQKVNYQIHCGPALGAFNQWVKGTDLENWKYRHVDEIGIKLLNETAQLLNERFQAFSKKSKVY
ncbi:ACP S-malonyltransferase [Priestia aryabhattai]